VNAAQGQWRQLGTVLVEAGLLTESQLASALEDQQRTGRKLGEIIVDRGFVSSAAIANALAEQHGRVLKTEYGFGTGLRSLIDRRRRSETADAPTPDPIPPLRVAPQPSEDAPPLLRGPSQPPPEPELVVEPPPDPVPLPEPSPDPVPEPVPDPVPEPSPEPVPEPQREEVQRIEELVHALTQRDIVVEELREQLESQAIELGAARARLEELERELTELKQASPPPVVVEQRPLTEPAPEPEPEPTLHANGGGVNGEATSYLLCVPNATGFMLLERDGAAPSVGTEMELPEEPEGRYRVTKVVRSISSPTARPTAYLRRL
jgi:hypothetical protein